MRNGFGPLPLGLIEAGGSPVQNRYQFWVGSRQAGQQRFAKEVMQPIAVPLLVQVNQEEVGPLQQQQHLLTLRPAG